MWQSDGHQAVIGWQSGGGNQAVIGWSLGGHWVVMATLAEGGSPVSNSGLYLLPIRYHSPNKQILLLHQPAHTACRPALAVGPVGTVTLGSLAIVKIMMMMMIIIMMIIIDENNHDDNQDNTNNNKDNNNANE